MAQEIYNKTVFKRFFEENDPQVMAWAENVFEKVASPGILPTFIQKGGEDFASYWKTVCHLFALVVVYARTMNNIDTNQILFELFIENRGLVTNEIDTPEQMQYLFNNYVEEYRKRGRLDIVSKEGVILGELLRLIEYKNQDEFIFALLMARDTGWTMGYSSPTWNRTDTVLNITKGYEKSVNVEDLSKYPLLNPTGVLIVNDVDNEGNAIKAMTFTGNVKTGISSEEDKSKLLVVSPNLPYQISFKIKITGAAEDQKLHFGVQVYDELQRPVSCIEAYTAPAVGQETNPIESNNFVKGTDGELILPETNIYYECRGTISKVNRSFSEEVQLNFLNGRGLKFQEGVKYLSLELTQDRAGIQTNSLSGVYIYDIKIKPIYLPFYQGYLGEKNVIASFYENNSLSSNETVEQFIETYLVSYKNIFAAEEIYTNELQTIVLKAFSDDGNYLEGVSITINGQTYTTNINGEVTIELYPGDYLLNAEKDRFEDITNQLVTVTEQEEDENQLVYITMTGEVYQRQVTFRVIDENSRAVQGATVTFNGQFQTTGRDGTTSFMVYPGLYNYTVTMDTYYPINRSILVSDDMIETVTLSVIPTYAVTFNVKNSDGEIVTDAVVSIGGKTGNTSMTGSCTIDGLVEGDYTYNVTKSEWITETATIHVDSDMTVDVTMDPIPTYQVQFLVQDVNILIENSETPLQGAVVSFAGSTQTTNSQGLLPNPFVVKAGDYSYTVTLSGYDQVSGTLTVNEDHISGSEAGVVRINLAKGLRTVTFRVRDENNETVTAATVRVTTCDGEEITSEEAQSKLDSNGQTTIRLPEDHQYEFIVVPDNSNQYEQYSSDFDLGTSDLTINVVMYRATIAFTPTVYEEDQNGSFNERCQGARFTLTCLSNSNIPTQSAITNASGRLNTSNNAFRIPIGNYSIAITKSGYNLDVDHTSSYAGDSLNIVDLSPINRDYFMQRNTKSIRFRILDENNLPISGAVVTFAGASYTTDSSGYSAYGTPIRIGSYSGSITATGYDQITFTAEVTDSTDIITEYIEGLSYDVTVNIIDGNSSSGSRITDSVTVTLEGYGSLTTRTGSVTFSDVKYTTLPLNISATSTYYQSASTTTTVTGDVNINLTMSAELISFDLAAYVDAGVESSKTVRATYTTRYRNGSIHANSQTVTLNPSSYADAYYASVTGPSGGTVNVTYSCDGCLPVSGSGDILSVGDSGIIGYLYTALVFSTSSVYSSISVSRGYKSTYNNKTYVQGPSLNQRITSRSTLERINGSYYIQFTARNISSSFSVEAWPLHTFIYLVEGIFQNSTGLRSLPSTAPRLRGNNLNYMFYNTGITSIPSAIFSDMPSLTSSNKASAKYTFADCRSLTSVTGEIFPTYTGYHFHAFDGCSNLTTLGSGICGQGGPDDDFSSIFRDCNLTSVGNVFSRSTQMYTIGFAFANNSRLTSVPSNLIPTAGKSTLTSVYGMFYGCESFRMSNYMTMFSGCSRLTNFRETFTNCTNLPNPNTSIPTSVQNMYGAFSGCRSITNISQLKPSGGFTNVTSFGATFRNTSINSIPNYYFENARNVVSFAHCFNGCTQIGNLANSMYHRVSRNKYSGQGTALYAGLWGIFNNSSVLTRGKTVDLTSMFEGCRNMVLDIYEDSDRGYTYCIIGSTSSNSISIGNINVTRMFYNVSGIHRPVVFACQDSGGYAYLVDMWNQGGVVSSNGIGSHANTYTGTNVPSSSLPSGWK